MWKAISKEATFLKQSKAVVLFCAMEKESSFGRIGGQMLAHVCLFPEPFNIPSKKRAKVDELWTSQGDNGVWDPKFVRNLNDWEIREVQHFLDLLNRK